MADWTVFDSGPFQENLYAVPHDALVVLGAYGHGLIKQLAFGSKMELIQSVLSNSIVIVGPAAHLAVHLQHHGNFFFPGRFRVK